MYIHEVYRSKKCHETQVLHLKQIYIFIYTFCNYYRLLVNVENILAFVCSVYSQWYSIPFIKKKQTTVVLAGRLWWSRLLLLCRCRRQVAEGRAEKQVVLASRHREACWWFSGGWVGGGFGTLGFGAFAHFGCVLSNNLTSIWCRFPVRMQ